MLYILTINKTTQNSQTPNQRTTTNDVHIVDAVDSIEAESKLIQHYIDISVGDFSYEVSILSCNQVIS